MLSHSQHSRRKAWLLPSVDIRANLRCGAAHRQRAAEACTCQTVGDVVSAGSVGHAARGTFAKAMQLSKSPGFPRRNRCSYSLQVEAVTYAGQRLAMRQRTYSVLSDIKTAHRFAPMVAPPSESHDGHPGIAWDAFHKVNQRTQYRCGTALQTKHTRVNVTEIPLSDARKMGLDVAAAAKAA